MLLLNTSCCSCKKVSKRPWPPLRDCFNKQNLVPILAGVRCIGNDASAAMPAGFSPNVLTFVGLFWRYPRCRRTNGRAPLISVRPHAAAAPDAIAVAHPKRRMNVCIVKTKIVYELQRPKWLRICPLFCRLGVLGWCTNYNF